MSVQQLAMLLCFESKNTLPLSYLATATGLTGELLVKNVRAIADSGILSVHDKVCIRISIVYNFRFYITLTYSLFCSFGL